MSPFLEIICFDMSSRDRSVSVPGPTVGLRPGPPLEEWNLGSPADETSQKFLYGGVGKHHSTYKGAEAFMFARAASHSAIP